MRILLTAYGPFWGVPENITEKVADAIQAEWNDAEGELIVLKIPVAWRHAEQALTKALGQLNPDIVISTGHAEGFRTIAVETRYFNIAVGEDILGETRKNGVIKPGPPPYYDTNVDTGNLMLHLERKNIPAVLSADQDTATYLCNFAGYIVMEHIRAQNNERPSFIFLHLPPDMIPFVTLVRGVKEVINFLVSQAQL